MNLPQGVESKFRFILIVAKRARQLQAGAKPLVELPCLSDNLGPRVYEAAIAPDQRSDVRIRVHVATDANALHKSYRFGLRWLNIEAPTAVETA